MRNGLFGSLLAIFVLVGVGCGDGGPRLVGASGVVKYNNLPLEGATVKLAFLGEGHMAIGQSDSEGKFELFTNGKRGAPLGEATVTITKIESVGGGAPMTPDDMRRMAMDPSSSKPKSLIPEKYANPGTSQLKVTVGNDAKQNAFEFNLAD